MTRKRECDHCHAQLDDDLTIVKEWRVVDLGSSSFDLCPKCNKELRVWIGIIAQEQGD